MHLRPVGSNFCAVHCLSENGYPCGVVSPPDVNDVSVENISKATNKQLLITVSQLLCLYIKIRMKRHHSIVSASIVSLEGLLRWQFEATEFTIALLLFCR